MTAVGCWDELRPWADLYSSSSITRIAGVSDGTVHRCLFRESGEAHALKFPTSGVSYYELSREISALQKSSKHPNIISLLGTYRADSSVVFAFPFLP